MKGRLTAKRSRRVETPHRGRADLARLRKATEGEIERTSPLDLADLPADFWDQANLVAPPPKQAISLRVDQDILAWFKRQGPRYQTKINAVLRTYVVRAKTVEKDRRTSRKQRSA